MVGCPVSLGRGETLPCVVPGDLTWGVGGGWTVPGPPRGLSLHRGSGGCSVQPSPFALRTRDVTTGRCFDLDSL